MYQHDWPMCQPEQTNALTRSANGRSVWPTAIITIARGNAPGSRTTQNHLANGHIQITSEVQSYAAIVVTTVRSFNFQHQGSVSILEG